MIDRGADGFCFVRDGRPSFVLLSDERGLQVVGRTTLKREPEEFNAQVDTADRYYARMFRAEVNVRDRFVVFSRETLREQFMGLGYVLHMESRADQISIITYADGGNGFCFMEYQKEATWRQTEQVEIPVPASRRSGWNFGYRGFDSAHACLLFLEYNVPGALFAKEKVWLYDLVSRKYIKEWSIPRSKGSTYVLFLPSSFAKASYITWSQCAEPN